MKHLSTTVLAIAALFSAPVGAAALTVDFGKAIAPLRPELHSSGFGPTDHLLRSCRVWVHDDKRDLEEISVPVKDGRLVLEKPDELSAACLVHIC